MQGQGWGGHVNLPHMEVRQSAPASPGPSGVPQRDALANEGAISCKKGLSSGPTDPQRPVGRGEFKRPRPIWRFWRFFGASKISTPELAHRLETLEVRGFEPLTFSLRTRRSTN